MDSIVAQFTIRKSQLTTHSKVYIVSTVGDDLVRKAERGARVRAIRERLDMTGPEFAAALTRTAKAFGLKARYDTPKVSRLENGGRKVTAEEVAILLELDPDGRDAAWLVFGDVSRAVGRGKFRKGE